MDIFHINLLLNLYWLFEKTENKKEAEVGPFYIQLTSNISIMVFRIVCFHCLN